MESTGKPTPMLGEKYVLEKVIGEGAFSVVYCGRNLATGRKVAVKKLKTSTLSFTETEEAKTGFFREINFLKSLHHKAIPEYYEFILHNGRFFMIMEYVEGEDLLTILNREGKFSETRAYRLMRQLAEALLYMQERNTPIIFKDLKPSNLMETEDYGIKLIDFGAARFFTGKENIDTNILGTPGYAPPEAYGQASTNLSADVYSFGATFFHLVTGQDPNLFNFRFPSPDKYNPELSPLFCRLLQDCLKKREHRIADARELHERIRKSDPLFEIHWLQQKIKSIFLPFVKKQHKS